MVIRLGFVAVAWVSAWSVGVALGAPPSAGDLETAGLDGPKSVIRVDLTSAEVVTGLKRVLRSWDDVGTVDPGRSLDLAVTAAQRRRLVAADIPFEVVIEDLAVANAAVRAAYHSFPGLEADLADMAANYPAITELTSLGFSWEGRNIWCIEISDNPGTDEGEVGVVFMGLHHAREWPGLEVAYDVADRLTSNYGSDPAIEALVNSHRIWVIPCVNPDGYVYDHDQGNDWRKNRHPYGAEIGVDLNRNYGGGTTGRPQGSWGSIGVAYPATSHHPSQSVYVGPSSFSEPETQVVRDFFNARDMTIAISYHTHGELVIWPWGHDGTQQTDDDALMVSVGQGMAAEIGGQSGGTYTPQQATSLYPATGDTTDWVYGYRYYELGKNTLAYTVEIGESYHPPASGLQQILDENWDGALYVLQQAASAESQMTPFVLPPVLSTPTVDADGDFTVSWAQQNPDAGADTYELQELIGLSVLTEDVESGGGDWDIDGFLISTARSHSSSHSFKSPPGDAVTAAITTTDPLPVAAGDEVTFWTWYDIETNWDMAFVEVSIDGRKYDVLDKFTGLSTGWVQKTYSLAAYEGRSIYLRFRYTTDGYVTEEGFYVDDLHPVASWSSITTLSSSITDTSYPIAGRSDGDYFYRVKGSNPTREFGQFCDLSMTRVYANLADADGDGDHDLDDFGDFQLCFGGDAQATPGTCAVPTAVFDFDLDQDVDLTDLTVFNHCLTAPDGPTPPECPF